MVWKLARWCLQRRLSESGLIMFGYKKCDSNHWSVVEGQLILDTTTEQQQEISMRMVAGIEAKVRLKIYEEICSLQFTENRKALVKAGIDNVALTVQSMCADAVLGGKNG